MSPASPSRPTASRSGPASAARSSSPSRSGDDPPGPAASSGKARTERKHLLIGDSMMTNANQNRSPEKTVLSAVLLAVLVAAGAATAERGSRLNIAVSPNRQTLPDNADDKRQNL